MATCILLTQLAHAAPETDETPPAEPERRVVDRIRAACPEVEWAGSRAVLGPYDRLDVFRASDGGTAIEGATIVRRLGHARAEVWGAREWLRSKELARDALGAPGG